MNEKVDSKVQWEVAKVFVDSDFPEIVVSVHKLPLFRPFYSIQIGCLKDGKLQRFMKVQTSGQGNIVLLDNGVERIGEQIKRALAYVLEERQKREDEVIELQQTREKKHTPHWQNKDQKRTGKTEKNRKRGK